MVYGKSLIALAIFAISDVKEILPYSSAMFLPDLNGCFQIRMKGFCHATKHCSL